MRSTPVPGAANERDAEGKCLDPDDPVNGVSAGILGDTSLNHLLSPKFISARARPLGKSENRAGRLILFFL